MEKKQFLEVPVSIAKQIADDLNKDQVIIITWNREHHSETVTTYGKTIHDSDMAANGGNKIKQALGWSEQECNTDSIRVSAMLDALEAAKFELIAAERQKSTAYRLIDNLLRIEGGPDL